MSVDRAHTHHVPNSLVPSYTFPTKSCTWSVWSSKPWSLRNHMCTSIIKFTDSSSLSVMRSEKCPPPLLPSGLILLRSIFYVYVYNIDVYTHLIYISSLTFMMLKLYLCDGIFVFHFVYKMYTFVSWISKWTALIFKYEGFLKIKTKQLNTTLYLFVSVI